MPMEVERPESTKFEQWAIVEVMGHRRFSGLVTEQTLGGSSFVRVDVPEVHTEKGEILPAFSKLFGQGSIYCISPIAEDLAKRLAASWQERPVSVYDLPRENRQPTQNQLVITHDTDDDDDDEPHYYDDHADSPEDLEDQ